MKNVFEYLISAANRFPDKYAICSYDKKCTFSELLDYSSRIGLFLQQQKITKQPIGVFANRGINSISAFMGVIASGNYFVPIDPELPEKKLEQIIDNSGMELILGETDNINKVVKHGEAVCFHEIEHCMKGEPIKFDSLCMDEERRFYMLFTSGSTGVPKGVVKSHRAAISFIEAYTREFNFSDDEIIGNQTPFFFDASYKDILLMLKMGCTLNIIPTEYFLSPVRLIEYLNESRISFISWVPSALSVVAVLNTFSVIKPSTISKVFFVGEVMPIKSLNTWIDALPGALFVNLYGQTEISGICCFYVVKSKLALDSKIPIGKPLQNCTVHLVDNGSCIYDAWHTGEICITSEALADGYLDEENSSNKFVDFDCGNGPKRCFFTGDLAQYDESGNLIFVSRKDFQIKLMGRRIELGEIEVVASAIEEIDSCCAIFREKEKQIYLYCQLAKGSTISSADIRKELQVKLAKYMVPSQIIILEHIPLSRNGKIDRVKLQER